MKNTTKNVVRNTLASLFIGVMLASAPPAFADEAKIPVTVADHEALAKDYRTKAASFRKEQSEHLKMAESYRKSPANMQDKRGQKNPWVEKAIVHCNAIATKAGDLAVEAEKAADFHALRGKELQGK